MLTRVEKIFARNKPVAFFLKKSKNWKWGHASFSVFDVIKMFHAQVRIQGLRERAGAIAFNFIMSIPPSFLFIFSLIPNLPFISTRSIKYQLHNLVYDIIPSTTYNREVIKFIDSFIDGNKLGLLSFGLLLSLFFASNGMMGLMRSFNKNYIGFEKRKNLHQRWLAIKLTVLLFGLLLSYLLLLIMQGAMLKLLVSDSGWRDVIRYTRWILILLLIFFSIAFIFKYAPSVEKKWKLRSPGTILSTTLSVLATLGFAAFVNSFGRYNALYGSIGTIMVVMALIFINSLALLIGFELNVSIETLKKKEAEHLKQTPPPAPTPPPPPKPRGNYLKNSN